jgi:chaperonin GroES
MQPMQTIEPNRGYLLAKPRKKETETLSGFLLSERSAEAPKIAEVIAVGDDVQWSVGDFVIYKPYAMTEVQLNGEEHYLIHFEDILGRFKDND